MYFRKLNTEIILFCRPLDAEVNLLVSGPPSTMDQHPTDGGPLTGSILVATCQTTTNTPTTQNLLYKAASHTLVNTNRR